MCNLINIASLAFCHVSKLLSKFLGVCMTLPGLPTVRIVSQTCTINPAVHFWGSTGMLFWYCRHPRECACKRTVVRKVAQHFWAHTKARYLTPT